MGRQDDLFPEEPFKPWHRKKTPGEEARDEAIERVVENAGEGFSAQVLGVVAAMPPGTLCTGESIRLRSQAMGIEPHHSNAWGGVISGIKMHSGLLEETGRYVKMKDPRSHARMTAEYRRRGAL